MHRFLPSKALRQLLSFLAIFSATLVTQAQTTGSWPLVGKAGFTKYSSFSVSLSLDTSDVPYAAYFDTATRRVNAMKYVNSVWTKTSTATISDASGALAGMAIQRQSNTPYVVYADFSGANPLLLGATTVKKLTGTTWSPVGPIQFSQQPVMANVIAVSPPTGTVAVAYQSYITKKISVCTFLTTAWVKLGADIPAAQGPANGLGSNISLAIGPDGTPYIAYIDTTTLNKISVRKWDGTTWKLVGTAGFSPAAIGYPSIAIDGAGAPYVAFSAAVAPYTGSCMRFNGNTWVAVGLLSTGPVFAPAITTVGAATPVVSFIDGLTGRVSVKKYAANAWTYISGQPASGGAAIQQTIALSKTMVPYIAYSDITKGGKITVLRYNQVDSAITTNKITGTKTVCGDSTKVSSITGQVAHGGNGQFAYSWVKSTDSIHYLPVPGQIAANLTYSPPQTITKTTWFKRVVVSGSKRDTSASVAFYLYPIVVPAVQIKTDTTTICDHTNVTITAIPTNPGSKPKYAWTKNDITTKVTGTVYKDSLLKNGDVIQCIITSNQPCASPVTRTSNPITFKVNPTLATSVTITEKVSSPICAGTVNIFKATVVNGGTAPLYTWYKSNVVVGANAPSYTDSTLKNNDSVWCVVTSNAACLVKNNIKSNVFKYTVNPNLTPALTVTINTSTGICAGTLVTFTANATGTGANPHYAWQKNTVAVGTDSNVYTDATLKDKDSVICTLTVTAPCAAPVTVISKQTRFIVTSKPAKPGPVTGPTSVVPLTKIYPYSAAIVPGATSYSWTVPADAVLTATDVTRVVKVTWGSAGVISVTAQNACGVSDTASLTVTTVPGLLAGTASADAAIAAGGQAKVYPNPAADEVKVSFSSIAGSKYQIEVVNASGRIMQTVQGQSGNGVNNITLNISKLAQGMYYIRITDKAQGTRILKVLKQNNAGR